MLDTMTKPGKTYVQYGCGFSVGEGWINYDSSPTLRLQRLPGVGSLVRGAAGVRFPDAVRYGDIRKGPLVAEGTCDGIYASHVLEHLSLADFEVALRNTWCMLRPGGIFRLIVPDLAARARRYVELLDQRSDTANMFFLESTHLGVKQRPSGVVGHLRGMIGNSAHLWMWDEHSMARKLADAGFSDIRRCDFADSTDPMFAKVESPTRFVDEHVGVRELAMECRRPATAAQ